MRKRIWCEWHTNSEEAERRKGGGSENILCPINNKKRLLQYIPLHTHATNTKLSFSGTRVGCSFGCLGSIHVHPNQWLLALWIRGMHEQERLETLRRLGVICEVVLLKLIRYFGGYGSV